MFDTELACSSLDVFSADYPQARTVFLQNIEQLACAFRHIPHLYPAKGPLNETLFTDSLWLGPANADNVLVLISATHGVEGFAGTAIQTDFLRRIHNKTMALPPHFAVLMIHALNPWGYAWLRRCDHEGIDLNRNFINFNQTPPDNPGFLKLEPYLVPLHHDRQYADSMLAAYLQEHGRYAYERAVSAGQYCSPMAPFYGGNAPAHSRRLIEQLIQEHHLATRRLAVIDIHSGLGPYGYGEIICDHPLGSPYLCTAKKWYGYAVTEPAAGTSSSIPKLGLLDYAWQAIMSDQSCFITLEFGSFGTDALFEVIREDHILHAQHKHPDWQAPKTQAIKRAIRHHFYPDDDDWKESVLLRGRQVIRLALKGLSRA